MKSNKEKRLNEILQSPGDYIDKLILEYNNYITDANEKNLYESRWRPACLAEFHDNEFQDILDAEKNTNKQ